MSFVELTRQRKRKQQRISIVMPTGVRVESMLDHRSPTSAAFNRFGVVDAALDKDTASVAANIRVQLGTRISVADAHVGATVLVHHSHDDVTILTSDPGDMVLVSSPVPVVAHKL